MKNPFHMVAFLAISCHYLVLLIEMWKFHLMPKYLNNFAVIILLFLAYKKIYSPPKIVTWYWVIWNALISFFYYEKYTEKWKYKLNGSTIRAHYFTNNNTSYLIPNLKFGSKMKKRISREKICGWCANKWVAKL